MWQHKCGTSTHLQITCDFSLRVPLKWHPLRILRYHCTSKIRLFRTSPGRKQMRSSRWSPFLQKSECGRHYPTSIGTIQQRIGCGKIVMPPKTLTKHEDQLCSTVTLKCCLKRTLRSLWASAVPCHQGCRSTASFSQSWRSSKAADGSSPGHARRMQRTPCLRQGGAMQLHA